MERPDSEQWKAREVARLLALVETERRYYQEIVASVPVALLVSGTEINITSSNREVRKIFGLRSGDPVKGQLDTLLPAWVQDHVREVLSTGKPQSNLLVKLEGEAGTHVRVAIQPIRNWDDEAEQEALLTIEDVSGISAPALAGQAAGAPEHTAPPPPELLENLDAIIWAVELPSKQFLYVNDKAQELLGHPAEKWLNTPEFWSERIHAEDRKWVVDSYDRAIENWSRHSCEYRAQTSYGRVVWLRETARLLVDQDGQSKHLIGIAVDVTQRRLLEDLVVRSQRMDAVRKLGNRVSHEIHNLLTVVSGYGEELIQGLPSTHPLHGDLQEILSATDRLRELANQLSLFGRRAPAPAETVDLGALIGRIEPKLKGTLGEKIALDVKMFPATMGVQADAAQLEHLIVALGERAGRAMGDGGKLTIECSPLEITEDLRRTEATLRPGVYAVLSIEDTGPTPDPEARTAMFESVLAPREVKDENAALLSRMYASVKKWGGDISVSVNSPQGTAFQVFLPRMGDLIQAANTHPDTVPQEAEHELAAEPVVVADPPPMVEPQRETILIAEEDAGIRALVKKMLRRQNYVVIDAASADEVLKATQEHDGNIDLLISDVTASQFDGVRLAEKIASGYPKMKVLYLSGYTDDPSTQPVDLPSGAAFLQKPFTLGSLINKVKQVLEAKPD